MFDDGQLLYSNGLAVMGYLQVETSDLSWFMWYLQVEKSDFRWAMGSHLIICSIVLLASVTVMLQEGETSDFSWCMC
jgi:hypothetical protein